MRSERKGRYRERKKKSHHLGGIFMWKSLCLWEERNNKRDSFKGSRRRTMSNASPVQVSEGPSERPWVQEPETQLRRAP